MRVRAALLATIAVCSGCEPIAQPQQTSYPEERVTVSIVALTTNPCAVRWNGQPTTVQQVLDRSADLVNRAAARDRGRTDGPPTISVPDVEVAPTLTFSCIGPILAAIQRGGMPWMSLRPLGEPREGPLQAFEEWVATPHRSDGPPVVTITVGPNGQLGWNGVATDLEGTRRRRREYGSPELEDESRPLALRYSRVVMTPMADATFGDFHRQLIDLNGLVPVLNLPGASPRLTAPRSPGTDQPGQEPLLPVLPSG